MARKAEAKTDIGYFSLDVRFNDNMNLYIAETGLIGLGVMICLWQKIYSGRGYYTDWNEDIALLYGKTIHIPESDNIHKYIDVALKRNIFDLGMYEKFSILTSRGIQERYLEATERRKVIKLRKDFLLIEVAKNNNVNIIEENEYIYLKNASKGTQIKSNQIRSNKTKLNENKEEDSLLLKNFCENNLIDDEEKCYLKIYDFYFQPTEESYEQDFSDMSKIYRKAKDKLNVSAALDKTKASVGVRNPLAYIKKVCEDMDLYPEKYEIADGY